MILLLCGQQPCCDYSIVVVWTQLCSDRVNCLMISLFLCGHNSLVIGLYDDFIVSVWTELYSDRIV